MKNVKWFLIFWSVIDAGLVALCAYWAANTESTFTRVMYIICAVLFGLAIVGRHTRPKVHTCGKIDDDSH